jgi:hypothetical protein
MTRLSASTTPTRDLTLTLESPRSSKATKAPDASRAAMTQKITEDRIQNRAGIMMLVASRGGTDGA